MAKAKGSAKGKRPARKAAGKKVAARKAATRKSVAAKLAVKTKVPKARAKALVDDFQGKDVNVETEYAATLTMLRVSPTKITED